MKAITPADLVRARLPSFERRVAAALRSIEEASVGNTLGVSFSSGKDSTVVLDLVRRVVPDVSTAFFDSGCEYESTYEVVAHYGVQTIYLERSLPELCRYVGAWGAEAECPGAEVSFSHYLIDEPSRRWAFQDGLSVIVLGLRAQESKGRKMNVRRRGSFYEVGTHSCRLRLLPIASWSHDDVWAYVASRGLKYNAAYDKMAELGIPRDSWRVSTLMGMCGAATMGRYSYLAQVDPKKYNELVRDFPKIAEYL